MPSQGVNNGGDDEGRAAQHETDQQRELMQSDKRFAPPLERSSLEDQKFQDHENQIQKQNSGHSLSRGHELHQMHDSFRLNGQTHLTQQAEQRRQSQVNEDKPCDQDAIESPSESNLDTPEAGYGDECEPNIQNNQFDVQQQQVVRENDL